MNKKQGIIICVLLALIISMAVLATKLNSPLVGMNGDSSSVISFNNNEKNSNIKTEVFATMRTDYSQKRAVAIQNYKNMIDDKNVSQESKKDAEAKYIALTVNGEYESKIELALKAKGYDEVLCLIEDNKAKVVIKVNDKLTDKQVREIKNEVMRVSKISDVEVEPRQ